MYLHADTPCADPNETAAAEPQHTVRVLPDGLEIDGVMVRPDFYELASSGKRGAEMLLRFTGVTVADTPDPQPDQDDAEYDDALIGHGYGPKDPAVTVLVDGKKLTNVARPVPGTVHVEIHALSPERAAEHLDTFRQKFPGQHVSATVRIGN